MKKCLLILVVLIISLELQADTWDETIETMMRIANQYEEISNQREAKYDSNRYKSLCSLLDTIDDSHITGFLSTAVLCDLIEAEQEMGDSVAVFTHLLDLRNRIYDQISRELNDSYSYALSHKSLQSYDWMSEGRFCLDFYKQKTLDVMQSFPNPNGRLFAYDVLLRHKGLSLMAANSLKFISKYNNNDTIKRLSIKLNNLKNSYRTIELELSRPNDVKRQIAYYEMQDSLSAQIRNTTDSVFIVCGHSNPVLSQVFTPWSDIRDSLSEKSIAIEFAERYLSNGDREYSAFVLDNLCSAPFYIPMCKRSDLTSMKFHKHSDYMELYRLIWAPLSSYTENKDTIYFSADGYLHSCPLEYSFTDNVKMYRLSSTRELTKLQSISHPETIVLFGNLDYDLDISRPHDLSISMDSLCYSLNGLRTFSERYGVDPLPETKREVEEIGQLFKESKKQDAIIFTEAQGTEDAFKLLSSRHTDIIHIASHGFFWSAETARQREYIPFLLDKHYNLNPSDSIMIRSGLLFSGANHTLSGEALPNSNEDGVVTAYELTNLDFGTVDMVVMSACDSGLGEIYGEGVFGLQRGFKLAGANTLLMSLWKVDDKATRILMTEFYRHYLSGKSKLESLHLAQMTLRNNSDYNNPKYWASFILLDALN